MKGRGATRTSLSQAQSIGFMRSYIFQKAAPAFGANILNAIKLALLNKPTAALCSLLPKTHLTPSCLEHVNLKAPHPRGVTPAAAPPWSDCARSAERSASSLGFARSSGVPGSSALCSGYVLRHSSLPPALQAAPGFSRLRD